MTDSIYAKCRSLGHAWLPGVAASLRHNNQMGVALLLTCDRCGMQRTDIINRRGKLLWRKYDRPDDYVVHGPNKPTRDDWRVMLIKSMIVQSEPPKESGK